MQKILVSGLCIQGNKGGEALALSLKGLIERQVGSVALIFAVPARDIDRERIRAEELGLEVIPQPNIKQLVLSMVSSAYRSNVLSWRRVAIRSKVVIDMTAVAYASPPVNKLRTTLNGRFLTFALCRIFGLKMVAWTQSYGPLEHWLIRALCKWDLSQQKYIFCRGRRCMEEVLKLLPSALAYDFPDVAISLDRGILPEAVSKKIGYIDVVVAPSAVLYEKLGWAHIQAIVELCNWLCDSGRRVLLLPHTYRGENESPEWCDFAVCKLIYRELSERKGVHLLCEDFGARELKAIISSASFVVAARYHCVVASLSSGVPCIALSWHSKYADLLESYGLAGCAVNGDSSGEIKSRFSRLEAGKDLAVIELQKRHEALLSQLDRNCRLLTEQFDGAAV